MPLEAKECQTRLTLQAHFSAPIGQNMHITSKQPFELLEFLHKLVPF